MIKIDSKKKVTAKLVSSKEYNIPHLGLVSNAIYTTDEIPFSENIQVKYKVTFWNRHAPVEMQAEIITATISDTPMIVLDCNGNLERDKDGNVLVTRSITVMCPKTKEGVYCRGYSPEETIYWYINNRLMPTTWGNIKGLAE